MSTASLPSPASNEGLEPTPSSVRYRRGSSPAPGCVALLPGVAGRKRRPFRPPQAIRAIAPWAPLQVCGGHGKRPERVKNPGTRSLTRQESRDRDRADQREHKAVGLKTAEKLGRHG